MVSHVDFPLIFMRSPEGLRAGVLVEAGGARTGPCAGVNYVEAIDYKVSLRDRAVLSVSLQSDQADRSLD